LSGLLRRQRPDLIQTFLYHANVVGARAARRAGVPRRVAGVRVADRGRRLRVLAERWIAKGADCYVCVSNDVAEFCRDELYFPSDKLTVIPNGIDVERFERVEPADRATFGIPPEQPVLVFVGRLDPQKRVLDLIRLAPNLLERLPRHHLLIVGDGPLEREARELVQRLGLGERVHLAGWRADVPAILAGCRLLLLPSRWEGLPNVVLEAMAAGLPVVASRVEGVEQLLGEGGGEQIVEADDLQTFADRAVAVASDEQLSRNLGEANRKRVRAHFSLQAMVARYDRLYRSLNA